MKNEKKINPTLVESLEAEIRQLKAQISMLKDIVLMHKSQAAAQAKQKSMYLNRWQKSQQQRLELLKQYKEVIQFLDSKNIELATENSQEENQKLVNMTQYHQKPQQQYSGRSLMMPKKQYTSHRNLKQQIKDSGEPTDLIIKYLLKKKLSTRANEDSVEQEVKVSGQESQRKRIMTLKDAKLADIPINRLNVTPSYAKLPIPKQTERKKSYFEKKKSQC